MEFPKHIVGVVGLVTNKQGKVLLTRHPRRGWQSPGGQVEVGEDLITALQREVEEETGIVISMGKLTGVYSNVKQQSIHFPTWVIFGFLGEKLSGELRTSEESPEVGWFSRDKVLNMISHPTIGDRMKDMLNFSGKVVYRVYSTDPYKICRECFL